MAKSALSIDKYLKRQHDVFTAYVNDSGKETTLLPFISAYSEEDGINYKPEDMFALIDSYLHSNLITEEEKELYNQTLRVPSNTIFKRGKIITELIIENQGSMDFLAKYQEHFAKKDGKLEPYSENYLLKCRDYYLEHTTNVAIKEAYQNVLNLSDRGQFDVELINQILEFKTNEEAIEFIHRINISKTSIIKLAMEYQTLYPANLSNIKRLSKIIELSFKKQERKAKFIDDNVNTAGNYNKVTILRKILEEYLLSDIEDISELFPKYSFNRYKFNETIKDAKASNTPVLNSLIDKYRAKDLSIANSYKEIIDNIRNAYENGINYGYGYREFNIYDYYYLKGSVRSAKLVEYAKRLYNVDEYKMFYDLVKEFDQDNVTSNKETLIATLRTVNDITEMIIDYLVAMNLPLTEEMYNAVETRYYDKDITCETNLHVA